MGRIADQIEAGRSEHLDERFAHPRDRREVAAGHGKAHDREVVTDGRAVLRGKVEGAAQRRHTGDVQPAELTGDRCVGDLLGERGGRSFGRVASDCQRTREGESAAVREAAANGQLTYVVEAAAIVEVAAHGHVVRGFRR